MSPRAPLQHARTPWPAVLAVAVLFGVLAMTWFAPQRLAHADGVGTVDHSHSATHQAAGHEHNDDSHLRGHEDDDHSHAADILLGAFLALLAIALLTVWARRPQRPMVLLRRVRTRVLFTGRSPDPPNLTRLSILRC